MQKLKQMSWIYAAYGLLAPRGLLSPLSFVRGWQHSQ